MTTAVIGSSCGIILPAMEIRERGDIYIDAADSSANSAWLDTEASRKWVLLRLAEQGVTMRAA